MRAAQSTQDDAVPPLGSDSRPEDRLFHRTLPALERTAKLRASFAVLKHANVDRDDLMQEALIACWRATPYFCPDRASPRTFYECVMAARLATVIRAARRRPTH